MVVRYRIIIAIITAVSSLLMARDVIVTDAPFSAKGDSVTNDRAAIQRAIDTVYASGGGKVTLPAGKKFLSGDLTLKSNVNFVIEQNAVLKQSANANDYAHKPTAGRWNSNMNINWNGWQCYNYPLIHALSGTKNVKVTGLGIIVKSYTGDDNTTLHIKGIGFFGVDSFEISDVTITNSVSYNIYLGQSRYGLVKNVKTTNPVSSSLNNDGVSIMNSQNIRVTGCNLTCNDDIVYIWTSYQDPRKSWWNSDNPIPSRNIEIDNNIMHDGGYSAAYHGMLFIAWGGHCPDPRKVEISNINWHDNTVICPNPIAVIGPDAYVSGAAMPPAKDITFNNNTITARFSSNLIDLGSLPITNFSGNFSAKKSESNFKNSGFETIGTCYWSERKNSDTTSTGAKNNVMGQDGSWYGFIDKLDKGDAKLFEGLYRTAGGHSFSAKVQSSGANVRMFVRDSSDKLIAAQDFTNTAWQLRTLIFNASKAGNYKMGIERGCAANGWARIDAANVSAATNPNKVTLPQFTPAPRTYSSTQTITLASESGATIRYTLDGSVPTATSTLYSNPISVSSTATIRAQAFKTGMTSSDVASEIYTIATTGLAPQQKKLDRVTQVLVQSVSGSYRIAISEQGPHRVNILDPQGRNVSVFMGNGPATYSFSRRQFSSGIYLVRIQTASNVSVYVVHGN